MGLYSLTQPLFGLCWKVVAKAEESFAELRIGVPCGGFEGFYNRRGAECDQLVEGRRVLDPCPDPDQALKRLLRGSYGLEFAL